MRALRLLGLETMVMNVSRFIIFFKKVLLTCIRCCQSIEIILPEFFCKAWLNSVCAVSYEKCHSLVQWDSPPEVQAGFLVDFKRDWWCGETYNKISRYVFETHGMWSSVVLKSSTISSVVYKTNNICASWSFKMRLKFFLAGWFWFRLSFWSDNEYLEFSIVQQQMFEMLLLYVLM